MLRTGVTRRGARLDRQLGDPAGPRFALTLLEDLARHFRPEDERLLSRLYDEVVVGGKVYKTTRRDRFQELDGRLVEEVVARWASVPVVDAHDVGASNAITSLDLFRKIAALRPVRLHASDWFESLWVVEPAGSRWTVVFDQEREPLQLIGRRFVLSPRLGEGRRHPVNRLLLARARRRLLPAARALLGEAIEGAGAAPVRRPSGVVRRLPLWHPECLRAAAREPGFTLGRHDLFRPADSRFHLIRAMNVLNPGYFPPERIADGVRALAAALHDGGLLVVGRTLEESGARTRASAFVGSGGRLLPAFDLHDGAENRDLILAAAAASSTWTP